MVLLGVKGLTQFYTCIVKQLASALSMDSAHEEAQQYFPIFSIGNLTNALPFNSRSG